MKKNLLLYILVAFLVVMNGFLLFQNFSSSDLESQQKRGVDNFIAKQLKFDDEQTKQFEKLDVAHHEKIKAILDDMKVSKDMLFDQLTNEVIDESELDSMTKAIAEKQVSRELETFHFFRAVSNLCNAEQKIRFKELIKDAVVGPGERRPGENGPPGRPGEKGPPRGHGGPDGLGDENRPPPPAHR